MIPFFLDKFEFDRYANLRWIAAIEKADLTHHAAIRKLLCHILNVHHIWNSRLYGEPADSGPWDDLPSQFWKKCADDNYRSSVRYIEHESLTAVIDFTSLEGEQFSKPDRDILFHILMHNQHHRAQIAQLMRQAGKEPPTAYLLNFH